MTVPDPGQASGFAGEAPHADRSSARRELGIRPRAWPSSGSRWCCVVAFAPWYDPIVPGDAGASVVQTFPPETGTALGR